MTSALEASPRPTRTAPGRCGRSPARRDRRPRPGPDRLVRRCRRRVRRLGRRHRCRRLQSRLCRDPGDVCRHGRSRGAGIATARHIQSSITSGLPEKLFASAGPVSPPPIRRHGPDPVSEQPLVTRISEKEKAPGWGIIRSPSRSAGQPSSRSPSRLVIQSQSLINVHSRTGKRGIARESRPSYAGAGARSKAAAIRARV